VNDALEHQHLRVLMERHDTDEPQAFELLRAHARSGNRTLVDIAAAVVDGRALLPGPDKH
jgi:AmiR/NasT family two-component response regulator